MSGIDLVSLSLADLHALYVFVSEQMNTFWSRFSNDAKEVIKARHREIEEELLGRAYGGNPLKMHPKPISVYENTHGKVVVLDEDGKPIKNVKDTFVVVKNKEEDK